MHAQRLAMIRQRFSPQWKTWEDHPDLPEVCRELNLSYAEVLDVIRRANDLTPHPFHLQIHLLTPECIGEQADDNSVSHLITTDTNMFWWV
jgi:hypothetical protein